MDPSAPQIFVIAHNLWNIKVALYRNNDTVSHHNAPTHVTVMGQSATQK